MAIDVYVKSMGKLLKVEKVFPDDDSANKYLEKNREMGVIAVWDGLVYVANVYQPGFPVAYKVLADFANEFGA